jgi:hypothetical protein
MKKHLFKKFTESLHLSHNQHSNQLSSASQILYLDQMRQEHRAPFPPSSPFRLFILLWRDKPLRLSFSSVCCRKSFLEVDCGPCLNSRAVAHKFFPGKKSSWDRVFLIYLLGNFSVWYRIWAVYAPKCYWKHRNFGGKQLRGDWEIHESSKLNTRVTKSLI